jgi:hypothetical protein
MAPALVVYTVVPKELKKAVDDTKLCKAWYVSRHGKDYVGLRERKQDAVERGESIFNTSVTKKTHIFLKTTFTEAGFAKYATLSTDGKHNFAPKLFKMVYYTRSDETAYDWLAWQWNGDLPLDVCENGQQLIVSEWAEMD